MERSREFDELHQQVESVADAFRARIGEAVKASVRGHREATSPAEWEVWQEVRIGVEGDFDLAVFLREAGCRCNGRELRRLEEVEVGDPEEIRLVRLQPAGFGFGWYWNSQMVVRAAVEWGLKFCPRETGIWLRAQYQEQPGGEQCFVADEGMKASDGMSGWILSVDREDPPHSRYGEEYEGPLCKYLFMRDLPLEPAAGSPWWIFRHPDG